MQTENTRRPYLEGGYAPVHEEITADGLTVEGEIPRDLAGMFVRNGSNPRYVPEGRYHWFDGDGMLHGVRFEDGRASYCNRWVRTKGYLAEQSEGRSLWTGVTERPDFTNPRGVFKDTANTDVVFHAGRLLATWWLGGEPYILSLPDLATCGIETFGRAGTTLSAHPKVDPVTGEMMFFDYKPYPPYLTYGVVSADGQVVHHTEIELAGPRLQHDMAITEHFAVLFDMSMMWDPELLARGRTKAKFFRDRPSRIGVLPRHGQGSEIRWFETSAFYMYHTINAWEEGDSIVLIGCRMENPIVDDPANPPLPPGESPLPSIGFLRLEPFLHRWQIDLVTGKVTEDQLDDVHTEFPRMDNRRLGRPSRYTYNPRVARTSELRFDAVLKYDTLRGTSETYTYPTGSYGGEVVFAPREGSTAEDDGYLVTFVQEEPSGQSWAYILDARSPAKGPVGRVKIPQRVPTGYHAWWVTAPQLAAQRAV